ncbi:uncharacterized protein LOC106476963, partial [Limulus polyphemus]|uniref:Uncharacterized protein LOC106476963 n=1 Tax=Limulus polyphemus TaxID=6850 RepID=A0ABM1RYE3_LIMPO
NLQEEIQQGQTVIDQINSDLVIVQRLTERTRPKQVRHSDVKKIEEDVKKITKRWDNGCFQVVERLRSCEAATELLRMYRAKMENDEQPWMMDMSTRIKNLKPINLITHPETEKQIQDAMEIYNTIAQRKSSIEDTNTLGGRYVREAKIYDLRLKHYRESLEEVHPSLDASIPKKAKVVVGADDVSQELDILNQNYTELVNTVLEYLNKLRELLSEHKDYKSSITISHAVPITPRSFHSELVMDQDSSQEPKDLGSYYSEQEGYEKVTPDKQRETQKIFTSLTEIPGESVEKLKEDLHYPKKRHLDTTAVKIKKIRPTRTLKEADDETSKDCITTVKGIVNPTTRELLTMAEAITLGILNIKTGQYTDLRSGKNMNLPDAVSKGLVDDDFMNRITESCGIVDLKTGIELTLIEAIQKGLFDPEKGHFLHPKDGRAISVDEAVRMGVITESKVLTLIERKIFKLTIIEAIKKGLLNPHTGQFLDSRTNQCMTLKEAFEKEFLQVHMPVWSEGGLPLTDAIDRGITNNETGQIVDEDSGESFTIDEAILRSVIRNNVCEVVNTESGEILCVPEALSQNVINAQMGRFVSKKTQERLTFQQAYEKHFLLRPLTLKGAHEQELLENTGKVTNPITKQRLTILEAMANGILNIDVKSVIDPKTEELVTLPEAFEKGLITPDGGFIDLTGEAISLTEAVDKGHITSVCHKMIFDVEGFRNPLTGDTISFNTAVTKDFIDVRKRTFKDLTSGETMTFEEAATKKFVQPQISEMINRKIGIVDEKGKELTVLEAVFEGLLDSKTGLVREPKTKRLLPLKEALQKKIITPEGAAVLKGLLNITVTMATVTKTLTHYVTVTSQRVTSDIRITFVDAVKNGLVDETRETFKEPNTGEIMPLEEAFNRGILELPSEGLIETSEEIPAYPTETFTKMIRRTIITHSEKPSLSSEKESPTKETEKAPVKGKTPSPTKEKPERELTSPTKEPEEKVPSATEKTPVKEKTPSPAKEKPERKLPSPTKEPEEKLPSAIEKSPVMEETPSPAKEPEQKLPSAVEKLPVKEETPSPTKEEERKLQLPAIQPEKETPVKEKTLSPTKKKQERKLPSPTKEEERKLPLPATQPEMETPVKEKTPSRTKKKRERKLSSPIKEEERKLPLTATQPEMETPVKEKTLSPTKEPEEKVPSAIEKTPIKEKTPSPTKEKPERELTSPTKEPEEKVPSAIEKTQMKEKTPSPTKEKPERELTSPTKEPEEKVPSAIEKTQMKEKTPSPTKEKPERELTSPIKEPEEKVPSAIEKTPVKEKTPSPTKEKPERKLPSPTKEPEEKVPSAIEKTQMKEKTPSPTKEKPERE